MDSTTIFLFNQEFKLLELVNLILNTILALAAISAVIFSALTFRNERYSRRALVAPTDDPGYLIYSEENYSEGVLLVKLKNYGLNPANNVRCLILFINDSETETNKNQISISHFFEDDFYCFNPLPYLAEFNIKSDRELFQSALDFGLVKYLLVDVNYKDKQLKRKFKDRFVWLINTDGRLMEVSKKSYTFLKNFTYDKKELNKPSKINH